MTFRPLSSVDSALGCRLPGCVPLQPTTHGAGFAPSHAARGARASSLANRPSRVPGAAGPSDEPAWAKKRYPPSKSNEAARGYLSPAFDRCRSLLVLGRESSPQTAPRFIRAAETDRHPLRVGVRALSQCAVALLDEDAAMPRRAADPI